MDSPNPEKLGKYLIVNKLGQGGMGEVFKAYDPGLERYVAIKTLHSHLADKGLEWLRREASVVARLRHPNIVQVFDFDSDGNQYYMVMEFVEGPTLRQKLGEPVPLNPDNRIKAKRETTIRLAPPQMVDRVELHRILDNRFSEEELRTLCFYLSIDYEDLPSNGQTNKARDLLQYLERHNRLPDLITIGKQIRPDIVWEVVPDQVNERTINFELESFEAEAVYPFTLNEVALIFSELANAIDYAHSRNMVHHDLKPANIMFTRDGQVVLTDFGIARILGVDHTASGFITGTPPYMSPEQCQGNRDDPRSDIYSLGVILFEVVTGKLPFEADDIFGYINLHINETVPRPTSIKPDLPLAVEQVILTALQKNPNGRYQSAGEMMTALRSSIGLAAQPANGNSRHIIDWSRIESLPLKKLEAPFQVPHDVLHFVGREAQLTQIDEIISQSPAQNFYCLTGMGGVGKTAMAIHLAHKLREKFPDGVLWANLAASEPLAILDSWARAFDFDFSSLPDLNSRAAALRGELAYKKVLFILDDVWSAEQVRPLLPSGADNIVLITTRDLDLPLVLDADSFPVSVMAAPESRLLINIVGEVEEGRGEVETAVVDEICELLGHLPLAVKIAARLLASRYRTQPEKLVARLHDENRRLATLKIRDREVRASFAVSWKALDENLQQSFSRLAVFEGRPFRVSALITVAEIDRITAEDHLYALLSLSLVTEESSTHYRQHPLLADFAREHLVQPEAAYERMTQYYLAFATQYQNNYTALDQEWDNLLSAMRIAHQQKQWQLLIDYTNALNKAWFARGRFSDARQGYEWAKEAATTLEDHPALAISLRKWGQTCIEQGDYDEATQYLAHSLQICEVLDDQSGVASAQYYLGRVAIERAQYDDAQSLLEESQHIREHQGDKVGTAETLWLQAYVQLYFRNFEQSERFAKQALDIQQEADDNLGSVRTLRLLGEINLHGQNNYELAKKHCRHALRICEGIQDEGELAMSLALLSQVYRMQGDLESAREHLERSLALLKRMGDRKGQARAFYRLSLVDADLKEYSLALQEGERSLKFCRELGDVWGTVYVLYHLGDILQKTGQTDQAQERWLEALNIAEEIQHPLSQSLRECLDQ